MVRARGCTPSAALHRGLRRVQRKRSLRGVENQEQHPEHNPWGLRAEARSPERVWELPTSRHLLAGLGEPQQQAQPPATCQPPAKKGRKLSKK